jgi:O-antigen/teichoic acid export membrane protein
VPTLTPPPAIRRLVQSELFRSALSAFVVRGLGAIAGFILSLVVARLMPVAESGLFFLGLTVVVVLATVGLLGLSSSLLRFIGAHHADSDWPAINAVAATALRWSGAFLALLSLALYFTAPWIAEHIFKKPEFGLVLMGFSPGVFFFGLTMLVAHQLQAIRRTTQSIVILSIAIPLGTGLGLLALGLETGLAAAILYTVMAATALVLGSLWWRRARPTAERGRVDARLLWASCFPLWIVMLMALAVQWSGQLIAGVWVPAEEVAHFAVAQRTAMLVSFILIAVNLVVAPRFAALHAQQKHAELEQLALRATRLMTLFALPVILLICLFPGWIMGWFGEAYRSSAPLLVILAVGQLVNVVTGSVGFLLSMTGHERDLRNVVLISGPLAIGAALILTPFFGVTGAAIATALAVACQNLLAVYRVKQRLGFNTLAIWKRGS